MTTAECWKLTVVPSLSRGGQLKIRPKKVKEISNLSICSNKSSFQFGASFAPSWWLDTHVQAHSGFLSVFHKMPVRFSGIYVLALQLSVFKADQ